MTPTPPPGQDERLLPCPFCGAESVPAMAMDMQGTRYYRQCNNCNMQGPDGRTREERDAAWNSRAVLRPSAPEDEVERVAFECFAAWVNHPDKDVSRKAWGGNDNMSRSAWTRVAIAALSRHPAMKADVVAVKRLTVALYRIPTPEEWQASAILEACARLMRTIGSSAGDDEDNDAYQREFAALLPGETGQPDAERKG